MGRREMQEAMWQDVDSGWAITAEFLSAVGVWFGVGWFLDRWLGTSPWLLLLGAALGFALGLYLAWVRLTAATTDEHARFQYRTKPGDLLAEATASDESHVLATAEASDSDESHDA